MAVADVAGHRVTVILRTAQQLAAVVGSNPFAEACQARALYVTFLEEPPDRDRVQAISPGTALPDEFRPAGQEIFVHCPKGYGRSVLTNDFFERRLGVSATTRNWRTVTTLARMSAA